jgi:hypothetical protein
MDRTDDALEAEWLSPEDLVEIDDDEERRVSGIRESTRSARDAQVVGTRTRRPTSTMHTLVALTRLALFFMLGLGLGSIFALGVATVLDIRDDGRRAPVHTEVDDPPFDSAGAPLPDIGKPGRAL